ncbi:PLP-dependent transferase [Exidia glandulosa HHB12029]|uniref:PLP-dependent transferase n=1 Tax=Exidia glandulosa HHB12029 TaxID=1314781 RepID=A0A165HB77_EXIGL|nr:PLP-dependent transferase [Exidia glandulosa HHB12029]
MDASRTSGGQFLDPSHFLQLQFAMSEKSGDAVDLGHHLSELAKRRKLSPLKGLQKITPKPGMVMLASGTPNPGYFPFERISVEALGPDAFAAAATTVNTTGFSWLRSLFNRTRTTHFAIPRYPAAKGDASLAEALQYGPATGLKMTQEFIRKFVERVYAPAYNNWTTLVDVGNTEGWSRCVLTFCNPGDVFLTDEWTYPSALALADPYQVSPVPVTMDAEGMSISALRELLASWDENARGTGRPHVLYTVSVGQNPCGMTTSLDRKKAIYEVCVEYDILIIEDDPYYFLQEGTYVRKSDRQGSRTLGGDDFIRSLTPSYLSVDYQGRVIRLETFSKVVAPGSRLGFFVCNSLFAERLERCGETATHSPSGFTQGLVVQLLANHWGIDNYLIWLQGLRTQYTARRDTIVDSLLENFEVSMAYSDGSSYLRGLPVYSCFPHAKSSLSRSRNGKQIGRVLSVVPPTAGLFLWVTLHFDALPPPQPSGNPDDPNDHETRLWLRIADAGVLVGPGTFFAAIPSAANPNEGHYRIAFSDAPLETLAEAMSTFSVVVHMYFEEMLTA